MLLSKPVDPNPKLQELKKLVENQGIGRCYGHIDWCDHCKACKKRDAGCKTCEECDCYQKEKIKDVEFVPEWGFCICQLREMVWYGKINCAQLQNYLSLEVVLKHFFKHEVEANHLNREYKRKREIEDDGDGEGEYDGDGEGEYDGDGEGEYDGDGEGKHNGDSEGDGEGKHDGDSEGDGEGKHDGEGEHKLLAV